jgi:hypothetical protein
VHRRLRTVVAGSALAVAGAGCAGPGGTTELPAGPATATSAASPTAAPTTAPADDQVLAAYRRFWDTVVAAHKASDPQLPALGTTAAEPELAKVRKAVALNRQQKISLRGTVGHTPRVTAVTGATATVEDCYDISAWDPVDVRTGAAIDVTASSGTGRYHARYTLRRPAGTWVVTDQVTLGGC